MATALFVRSLCPRANGVPGSYGSQNYWRPPSFPEAATEPVTPKQ